MRFTYNVFNIISNMVIIVNRLSTIDLHVNPIFFLLSLIQGLQKTLVLRGQFTPFQHVRALTPGVLQRPFPLPFPYFFMVP